MKNIMPKVPVYNLEGKTGTTMELSDDIFGVKPKASVVHQVYVALEANRRQPWAHTKGKGEVRGGGRKPWRQKGTGRARHGSIRSPLWKGGGVTFGPRNIRNFRKKINKKVNRLALKMCLSDKVADKKFLVFEKLPNDGKTKIMIALQNSLPSKGKSTLILGTETEEKLGLAIRNIEKFHMQRAIDVNVGDLLNHQYVIVTKEGVKVLEERLGK